MNEHRCDALVRHHGSAPSRCGKVVFGSIGLAGGHSLKLCHVHWMRAEAARKHTPGSRPKPIAFEVGGRRGVMHRGVIELAARDGGEYVDQWGVEVTWQNHPTR